MLKLLKLLLMFCVFVNLSRCDDYGVKGGGNQGIKSYGGVFRDSGSDQNPGGYQTYQQMNQQVPMFYQPVGWNYNNQNQRTYGGVIQQQAPQGFGWFGNQFPNQFPNQHPNQYTNPSFPKLPSLFLPNFVPPVYYPNTLPFPNYNPFPSNPQHGPDSTNIPNNVPTTNVPNNVPSTNHQHPGHFGVFPGSSQHGHHQNSGNVHNHHTNNRQGGPPQAGTSNRVDNDGQFATNAFFKPTDNERHWSEREEQEWQATTKAPYFENKVPGLECSLPAAAVLGATTALKASSLLPLNIPVGKPILSCNATKLLQAQINLNGHIYDCSRSAITISCPRIDSHNLIVDECQGETLECDVRMNQNTKSVSCTNGTLISNHPIVCKSAHLLENKNVLNCLYKSGGSSDAPPTPTRRPYPVTTSRSFETSTSRTSVIPLAPVTERVDEGIDSRHTGDNQDSSLTKELKTAMKAVFPHELMSKAPSQMYLPPKNFEMAEIPKELRNHLVGVFPHELFAMSQMSDLNHQDADSESRLSTSRGHVNNREQLLSQWDVNANRKSGNSGTFIKTSPNRLPQRFGGGDGDYDDNDRLIFSP